MTDRTNATYSNSESFALLAPSVRAAVVLAAACAAAIFACLFASSSPAYASVEDDDIIMGQTVEARGVSAKYCPDISSECAIVVGDDGTVYYERNADQQHQIASITKIMTAIVALENADLNTEVTVSKASATVGESSANLKEGDTMDLRTALMCLLIPSGNDAGIAIAETVGTIMDPSASDPQAVFVSAMNAKAEELGCTNTHFTNPHGLDADKWGSDMHSSARDVVTMARYAMSYDTFAEIVQMGDTTVTVTGKDNKARDNWLDATDDLLEEYEGMRGVKTGSSVLADFCFSGCVTRGDETFYTVVLGNATSDERFGDTITLMDWAFGSTVHTDFINSDFVISEEDPRPYVADVTLLDWPNRTVKATVDDEGEVFDLFLPEGDIEQVVSYVRIMGDVEKGDIVGRLEFHRNGQTLKVVQLIAAEDVAAPTFTESQYNNFDRFRRMMEGAETPAPSACYNKAIPA
ncbi:D-alanyl-D-alanine carboxypeptidase dacB precursor [Slackia heliotrinireducens]|uniref:D-alanyl-D-alanine carboxypeptidase n=1 Tax=Slackia heliotrinireducens (strain ATCC 29202 / DSM 20476 / NCTC 11029 / RHS 1) TaxID=471855 RepID=C7N631_SLAHD|nr:D-alanyl-D-alanine carboxypeptidase family protein [Slackia heliotrinireducens]ACV22366.1 D-alanyl-D-alanine carboxypeptidase [Slackia heliotrinireducens DSM 20476]VEH00645.1 D-alanyl-D-alanine carboxypeptidase dacB precursor [Slackia heliotrinireducens]